MAVTASQAALVRRSPWNRAALQPGSCVLSGTSRPARGSTRSASRDGVVSCVNQVGHVVSMRLPVVAVRDGQLVTKGDGVIAALLGWRGTGHDTRMFLRRTQVCYAVSSNSTAAHVPCRQARGRGLLPVWASGDGFAVRVGPRAHREARQRAVLVWGLLARGLGGRLAVSCVNASSPARSAMRSTSARASGAPKLS